jgi:hemerythrin
MREKLIVFHDRHILNSTDNQEYGIREFLQTWLMEHIFDCDMDYASTIAKKATEISKIPQIDLIKLT